MSTAVANNDKWTEQVELEVLLEALYKRYGYDFRSYTRSSLIRRIRQLMITGRYKRLSDLLTPVMQNEALAMRVIQQFSIPYSDFFRDPWVYRAIASKVFPWLETFPFFKVWHAGCGRGQEPYSMSILLKEAGLYERATLYGTDFNSDVLTAARKGIFHIDSIAGVSESYQKAGGKKSFTEYCHAAYGSITLDDGLKDRITFANHNLVQDGVFGEMHLILCRNVMIYFNHDLQDQVLELLTNSLAEGGFLILGAQETLRGSRFNELYDEIDKKACLYRKKRSKN